MKARPPRRHPERRELALSGAALPQARQVAFDILGMVLDRRRPLDQAVAAHGTFTRLEPRDRAFVRNLVATTLRRRGQIDAVITSYLSHELPPRGRAVLNALRLGAAQLLFLGTPAHAAVDGSVRLTETSVLGSYKGLVNAVLRRIAQDGPALIAAQDAPRLNTPDWLWQSWIAAYGEETALSIAQAHLQEPPLDLSPRSEPDRWAVALGGWVMPTGSVRRPAELGGQVEGLPGYAEGAWWVQDAAAALPVRMLGTVAGQYVIDLCAAPGGKTVQLAAAGARVTAVDRSPQRLERVASNLHRLRLSAELIAADAADWRPTPLADSVLLDAPCSATGTIRRHPDLPWLKQPDEISALAAIQDRLLRSAAQMVKPGGLLVYSVCSLEPEEGRPRVAALVESGAVAPEPLRAGELAGVPAEAIDPEGALRTLPSQWAGLGGWDGFYAARLRRPW
ncbi:MAG TPA: transcription antitermination factor NusB [Alphaproteobacteria bacterium]|nr:transcription antitermination factor NusB [Alphaproteobacteria bacterium]